MKNYIVGRIFMVAAFVICVGLFFVCIDGIEQSRIAEQMERVKINTLGNTTPCKTLTVEGGWIYFIPSIGHGNLYKVKLDGSERQKLVDKKISEFVLYEDKIYYFWRDYNEETDKVAEFGFICSVNTDGSDERQLTQFQSAWVRNLDVAHGRIYYINHNYEYGVYESNIHSIELDGSGRRIHSEEPTAWFKVIDDVIYYLTYRNHNLNRMLCSVKTDGSDFKLIYGNLYISLAESTWQNISIFGDTIYFNGTQSLKLDGSSALKEVKTDGTNIANGRIYYTDYNSYKTEKTEENPFGFCDEWLVCSAKINSRGKYEDEKVLYTKKIEMDWGWAFFDHYPYLIYIINDRLYFRSKAPNSSLYSMDLDGGDLRKIE